MIPDEDHQRHVELTTKMAAQLHAWADHTRKLEQRIATLEGFVAALACGVRKK